MDLHQMKHMLQEHGKNCLELAERMNEKGKPLSLEDRELLRSAVLPAVNECTDLLKAAFIAGDVRWLERESERLHNLASIVRKS